MFMICAGAIFYAGLIPIVKNDGTLFATEEEAEAAAKELFDDGLWFVLPVITMDELNESNEEADEKDDDNPFGGEKLFDVE